MNWIIIKVDNQITHCITFEKYKKRKNKKKFFFNKKCSKIFIWILNYLKILGSKDKYLNILFYLYFIIFILLINI